MILDDRYFSYEEKKSIEEAFAGGVTKEACLKHWDTLPWDSLLYVIVAKRGENKEKEARWMESTKKEWEAHRAAEEDFKKAQALAFAALFNE